MAVLGIAPSSVEEELLKDPIQIDKGDIYGATALCWAVKMNNLEATQALLKAGANPNILTIQGQCCLFEAAKGQNLAMLKTVLAAGALISARSNMGRNALHYVAEHSGDSEMIDTLVAAGIDINQQDTHGGTPLQSGTSRNNSCVMKALLRHHPKIDVPDNDGDTALLDACFKGCDEAIKILLHYGANYTLIDYSNNTILHKVARTGSPQTLNILRSANLNHIDTNQKNSEGKTAFEVAQKCYTKPDGFIELFLTVLFEIRMRNDHAFGRPKSSSDDCNSQSNRSAHDTRDNGNESRDSTIDMPGAWPCD